MCKKLFGPQSHLYHVGFEPKGGHNKINDLRPRERSILVAFPPPLAPAKAFSRSGCGRIFPFYSGVMREGLSTGTAAKSPGSGLSGPIFSGPVACGDLVNSAQFVER